jgi:hypothetical protein
MTIITQKGNYVMSQGEGVPESGLFGIFGDCVPDYIIFATPLQSNNIMMNYSRKRSKCLQIG